MTLEDDWMTALTIFAVCVTLIPIFVYRFPGKIPIRTLIGIQSMMGLATGILTYILCSNDKDPFPFTIIYSFALMVLCVECWFTEDPQLFNGTYTAGWPLFVFRSPADTTTMATIPMAPYTRIFSSWHAGGVSFCFFLTVVCRNFPEREKAAVSLPLSILWFIWASINSWRTWTGGNQFCQMGLSFHTLVGPGCGMAAYWHGSFWYFHRVADHDASSFFLSDDEVILWTCFGIFCLCTIIWFLTNNKNNNNIMTTTSSSSPKETSTTAFSSGYMHGEGTTKLHGE